MLILSDEYMMLQISKNKLNSKLCFGCRTVDLCIWRKLQTSGERMVKAMSGKRNGGSIMMPQAKLKNGLISGVALTQIHPLRLVMLISGMKGTKLVN